MTSAATWDPVVRVRVPAKINLGLAVGPLGEDGYHPLTTVFMAVGLEDDVVATATADGEITLTMSGEGAEVLPVDATNLAVRAAHLLRESHGDPSLGVALSIRKTIPVAGGMAGGSADAAATLLACAELWQLGCGGEQLRELAARLGADVPFCLSGGVALGTGRGDRLAPVLTRGSYHWVLALAEEGLSTPSVYRRFDELAAAGSLTPSATLADDLLAALAAGDARGVGAALRNDLQEPALSLRPQLRRVLQAGRDHRALGGIVSGSGPTVAFLARDEAAARSLSVALAGEGVCRALRTTVGPVPGARVVPA